MLHFNCYFPYGTVLLGGLHGGGGLSRSIACIRLSSRCLFCSRSFRACWREKRKGPFVLKTNKYDLWCHKLHQQPVILLTSQFSYISKAVLSLSSLMYRSSSALFFTALRSIVIFSWRTFFFFSHLHDFLQVKENNSLWRWVSSLVMCLW